ncbi:hypothetical protein B0I18_107219 [Taibaiella chishuiensis]|uniref:Uncharacterized protein n=1 Tax=Taibaiella chishuiensis TaxID=1434707 RepID=A0A2P8D0S7_9BACT|nr:hypothetical protein B0I18_107219 [Taibaiella chishuiensis]
MKNESGLLLPHKGAFTSGEGMCLSIGNAYLDGLETRPSVMFSMVIESGFFSRAYTSKSWNWTIFK